MISIALNITDERTLRRARRKGYHHCSECRKMINNTPTLLRAVTPLELSQAHYDVDGLLTSAHYTEGQETTEYIYQCRRCGFDNMVTSGGEA